MILVSPDYSVDANSQAMPDYIVARTTEWPLALADQGEPVDSTVQLL